MGNTSNTAVTWTITEAGGGTVTNGAYIAPTTAGTYHVVAVSQADPSKTATATVTVGAEKVLSVAVVPGSGTVNATGNAGVRGKRDHDVRNVCGAVAATRGRSARRPERRSITADGSRLAGVEASLGG